MVCCLFGAKPLSEPILSIGPLGANLSEIWIKIKQLSHKKWFQNVICKMAAILPRPLVKSTVSAKLLGRHPFFISRYPNLSLFLLSFTGEADTFVIYVR